MRKSVLALLIAAAGIAAVASTPADARQRQHVVPQNQYNQVQAPAFDAANDPTGVYRGGRLIGRDPDAAIRGTISQFAGHSGAP